MQGSEFITRVVAGREVMEPVCPTGRHGEHTFVPWRHGKPYDQECAVCGAPATDAIQHDRKLCDCCFMDWTASAQAKQIDAHMRSWRYLWVELFEDFVVAQRAQRRAEERS